MFNVFHYGALHLTKSTPTSRARLNFPFEQSYTQITQNPTRTRIIGMFQDLSKRLMFVLGGLKRQGIIREADLEKALREMRMALLEADVALPVVKELISRVHQDALGQNVLASLSPGQMIIKIVHDHVVGMLGAEHIPLKLQAVPPGIVVWMSKSFNLVS